MKLSPCCVLLVLAQALAGCDVHQATWRLPTAPTAASQSPESAQPAAQPTLRVFTDFSTHFSTSEVRDARGHIVQFNSAGELIWTADGTRLPGYAIRDGLYIPAEGVCGCWFEVRFGTDHGERRAYLTADYGHDNPGTLINLEIVGGVLSITRTDVYPPGTYTQSGVVFETTSAGRVPIEGAYVSRSYGSGWQQAVTDARGFYAIHGLYASTGTVSVWKESFIRQNPSLSIFGDTTFDVELVRQ